MATPTRRSFFRRFRRSASVHPGVDLADMGTAFALDQVFDRMGYEARFGDDALGAPAPAQAARPGWRRWLARKPRP